MQVLTLNLTYYQSMGKSAKLLDQEMKISH